MKIVIDARLYGLEHRGLGRYLVELIDALGKIDRENNYILLTNPNNKGQILNLPSNFTVVSAPWRVYSLVEQIKLPLLLRKIKPDLIHFPHFTVPFLAPAPFVVTIHDLILHHFPSERATTLSPILYWFKVRVYYLVVGVAIRRAKKIITISQAVAQDIINYYPKEKSKISIIPLAPGSLNEGVVLNLPLKYFLAVGAAYPHKNLELVLRALKQVPADLNDFKFIVVGRKDIFMERLEKYASELGLVEKVIFWGEASEGELVTLYKNATAYLLPSLAEGFGLGAVEALACGTPVIAADIPVLHEVLGQAALFVNPQSELDLIKAWQAIQNSETRKILLSAGQGVLQNLSWDKVAHKMQKLYTDQN
jgi:glycosyltransferase involved in cell wall biosynthesis